MSDENATKPTIETILERINALAGQVRDSFGEVNSRLDRIEESVQRLGSQVKILNQGMLEMRTDHELLARRVDNLESKAS